MTVPTGPKATSRVVAALGCFRDLSLWEGLAHVAEAGFAAVAVDVRENSPAPPAMVRDDYETAHLLLGFGCARAGLQPASLRISLGTAAGEDSMTFLRSSCALAQALKMPAVTVEPTGEPAAGQLADWIRLGRERETAVRLFLAKPEDADDLGMTAARLGMELATAVSLLPRLRRSAGAFARLVEVWIDVSPAEGQENALPPAAHDCPPGVQFVVSCSSLGEPAARIRRLSAVRQSLEDALRNYPAEGGVGNTFAPRRDAELERAGTTPPCETA